MQSDVRTVGLLDDCFFFLTAPRATEIYTLSLHDALPISPPPCSWPSAGASSNRWRSRGDRKSTRLNSSHANTSYAVFCLKKKHLVEHRHRARVVRPRRQQDIGLPWRGDDQRPAILATSAA